MPRYAAQIGSTLTGLRRTHAADLGNVGQGKSNVGQGALSGFVIPEFGIDQNPIMVKENVLFHSDTRLNCGLSIKLS